MSLPKGIDVILGLNWMQAQGVLLDTRNRRILYTDFEGGPVTVPDTVCSLVPIEHCLPLRCDSSNPKTIKNKVFKTMQSAQDSDFHICSSNVMKTMTKAFNKGQLNYCNYSRITQPIEYDKK